MSYLIIITMESKMAGSCPPAQTDKRVMILAFLRLTVLVKVKKSGSSEELMESSKVEELM